MSWNLRSRKTSPPRSWICADDLRAGVQEELLADLEQPDLAAQQLDQLRSPRAVEATSSAKISRARICPGGAPPQRRALMRSPAAHQLGDAADGVGERHSLDLRRAARA